MDDYWVSLTFTQLYSGDGSLDEPCLGYLLEDMTADLSAVLCDVRSDERCENSGRRWSVREHTGALRGSAPTLA